MTFPLRWANSVRWKLEYLGCLAKKKIESLSAMHWQVNLMQKSEIKNCQSCRTFKVSFHMHFFAIGFRFGCVMKASSNADSVLQNGLTILKAKKRRGIITLFILLHVLYLIATKTVNASTFSSSLVYYPKRTTCWNEQNIQYKVTVWSKINVFIRLFQPKYQAKRKTTKSVLYVYWKGNLVDQVYFVKKMSQCWGNIRHVMKLAERPVPFTTCYH